MKRLKFIGLLLVISCASPKIVYDYNTQEDFTQYKTFDFFEDAGEGLNDFDVKRICSAIEKTLQKQGLIKSEQPDFYINFIANTTENVENNNVGIGIGGGNGGFGVGVSTGISLGSNKKNQQLTIDFVSSKKDHLFWQSISESLVKENGTPDKRVQYYTQLIQKILNEYPPKKLK